MHKLTLVALALTVVACTEPPPPPPPPEVKAPEAPEPKAPEATVIEPTTKSPEASDLFKMARDTFEPAKGEAMLRKAIELDPTFALAHAQLAQLVPQAEAKALVEKASALGARLPEPERLLVEQMVASMQGDDAKAIAAEKRLGALMPNDYRVRVLLGNRAWSEQRYDDAIVELKHATELKPDAGAAWNMLGYVYMTKHQTDDAVTALQRYAHAVPEDPNAHDSLGDALLVAGKLQEAEDAFAAANVLDQTFAIPWTGIALSRALRADWPHAIEAMGKYIAAAPRPADRVGATVELAWWQFAAGKSADAEKTFTSVKKMAEEQKLDSTLAFLPLHRAEMMNAQGKFKDALKLVDEGVVLGAKAAMTGSSKTFHAYRAASLRLRAQAGLGLKDDAAKTAAEIEALIKALPPAPLQTSQLHEARGQLALAAGDTKAAIAELRQCGLWAWSCLALGVTTAEKAGDKAAATAMAKIIVENPARDVGYVLARSQAKLFPTK